MPRRVRLSVRIYLFVVVCLGAVAALAIGLFVVAGPSTDSLVGMPPPLQIAAVARAHTPTDLADALGASAGRQLTVYDASGRLIGTTEPDPDPPLDAAAVTAVREQAILPLSRHRFAAALLDRGQLVAYGIFELRPPPVPRGLLGGLAAVIGGALLVGSVAFARSLARPLKQLEAAADAFGRGNLDARVRSSARDEIGAVGTAFDVMAERMSELMRSHRELMANVAHELRTPMARIRMALDLAHEGDGELARTMLTEIDGDLGDLERLVQDVLMSARLDLAETPLRASDFEVGELVAAVVERAHELGMAHAVVVDVAAGLLRMRGDEAMLRRVLDNLLTNARTYSDEATTVTLRARPTATGVRIEVEDQGIGIGEADLARLFEPFYRADASRTRATGASGLGLALAKKIVDAHGGTITVTSQLGVGTIVAIELRRRGEHFAT